MNLNANTTGKFNPYGGNSNTNNGSMLSQQGGGQSIANLQWRSGLTRDQRQELISKMYVIFGRVCIIHSFLYLLYNRYNELIRATGEAPGPNVWMKASNYELKLFHESQDRVCCVSCRERDARLTHFIHSANRMDI